MSQWNLSVRLTGQGSGLTRTLRTLAREARDASRDVNALRRDIDRLRAEAGQGIRLSLRLEDPMQLRRDVAAAVRWASMNQSITVRVNADTSSLTGLTQSLGGLGGGSRSSRGMLQGLLALAPSAIPLVAGLSTGVAALAGQFALGGAAATAFGIALAGQIEPLTEAADAEKKYQEAVREHGRSSAEAMQAQLKYQQILASLPPEAQQAAIALSQLKQNFSDWSDDMAGFTMQPVTKGITILDQLIPRMTPHVESFSRELDRLMNAAGGAITTPGFDALADKVAQLTDQQLDEFTDDVIHLLRVVSEGDAGDGVLGQLMDYVRENGPEARAAIQAIGQAVMVLAEGAAEAGPTILTLVTAAARLVAALPPELVGIIIQVATALKLLQLSGAGMAVLAAGLGRVRTQIAAVGATSAAAGGGIAGLRAAFLALGTAAKASVVLAGIGALVYVLMELSEIGQEAPPDVDKLTSSLRQLGQTGKVTGEAARVFGEDLGDLHEKVRALTDPSAVDDIQQWIVTLGGLGDWDSTPVKKAKEDLDAVDKALAGLVKNGQADLAAEALKRLTAEYGKGGRDTSQFTKQLDDYESAIEDARFEQELAAASMGLFGRAAMDTQAKLEAQKKSADGLRQSILALNEVNRAAGSAMSAFEQSLDDVTRATQNHAGALRMRDGELDLGSQKARDAEKVLSELAANTDAAAAAAREQGKSWEHVNGIFTEGRSAFIAAADSMGLTRQQAEALADSYLKIPDAKSMTLEMRTEDAVASLNNVIAAIQATPDAKSVTVSALTDDAVIMLEALGYKVTELKDGRFTVTAETGTASTNLDQVRQKRDGLQDKTIVINSSVASTIADLQAVQQKVASTNGKTITMKAPTAEARHQLELLGFKIRDTKGKNVVITVPTGTQRANVGALGSAIAGLRDKTVTITTRHVSIHETVRKNTQTTADLIAQQAERFAQADGGTIDFYARGGMRRENHVAQIAPSGAWRVWAEDETGGEAYIPFARSKRVRSRAIAEETIRRLGGDPATIQWNANGNITDWRYDPVSGSLYSASDAGQAGHKTKKVKVKVKGKWQTKEVEYFDITAVEKKLKAAAKATTVWNKNLEKVADRVGGDVAEALASMGEDGMKLAEKMAKGSTKYINEMAAALRNLQKTAKASLTDYTRQMGAANKVNSEFSRDLAQLAAQGYGDLASQLAAQGDEAAMQLADAAARDKGKAKAANEQAKRANSQLTGEEQADLIQIIAAIKNKNTGIHAVADATGLGEDVIIDVGNKAKVQIMQFLGGRAQRFLADLFKANKGMAYADGGIRAGLYATQGGIIRFAEPSTRGEAYIPLGENKRRSATAVLSNVAGRFGLGLTDGQGQRVVIIREQGPLVGESHFHIGAHSSDQDLARAVEARQAYQLRRLARGGVGAR
ncbi:hypothetical protein [Streptomyces leeuwenhoekii]|uniref:Sle1_001 protein n=1 Tax=Streptomyces leeuwenhoekii TaxID=1437453 RepID=A0A0F7VM85_STRLW|nr:hypothetical protein [Streptomyces leeuwenhoekii]CQR59168.1 sle1_001 [Streptomyces leeuwenhoekii]